MAYTVVTIIFGFTNGWDSGFDNGHTQTRLYKVFRFNLDIETH